VATLALELAVELVGLSSVPARLDRPDGDAGPAAVLFAHGSNFGKDSAWTRAVVEGLGARGGPVLSFDYAYRARAGEGVSARTDRLEDLEHVHARALAALAEYLPDARLVLAGKSLGARLSTLLAAKGERAHGLALFGYPLHPRGPERLLAEHFPALVQPALFLQGTRDPLCDVGRLRTALQRYGGDATLHPVPEADHSFARPGDAADALPSVLDELCAWTAEWIAATWP